MPVKHNTDISRIISRISCQGQWHQLAINSNTICYQLQLMQVNRNQASTVGFAADPQFQMQIPSRKLTIYAEKLY